MNATHHFRVCIQSKQSQFVQDWKQFQEAWQKEQEIPVERTFDLLARYESLVGDLYRVRQRLAPEDPLRQRMEDTVANCSHDFATIHRPTPSKSGRKEWHLRYRKLWRENFPLFLIMAMVLVTSLGLGWNIVVSEPAFSSVLIPQAILESILDQKRWFDSLKLTSFFDSWAIAINNIKVCINCFVLGVLFGVGGVLLLIFNGLMIGSVAAFCYLNHFSTALNGFISAHGPLELTITTASVLAGSMFGRVFYIRPFRQFGRHFGMAAAEAACLLYGILPWLLLAGLVEGCISPWEEIPFLAKLGLGLCLAGIFWAWSLAPSREPVSDPCRSSEPRV